VRQHRVASEGCITNLHESANLLCTPSERWRGVKKIKFVLLAFIFVVIFILARLSHKSNLEVQNFYLRCNKAQSH
jgi:hypothetical protein